MVAVNARTSWDRALEGERDTLDRCLTGSWAGVRLREVLLLVGSLSWEELARRTRAGSTNLKRCKPPPTHGRSRRLHLEHDGFCWSHFFLIWRQALQPRPDGTPGMVQGGGSSLRWLGGLVLRGRLQREAIWLLLSGHMQR